MLGPPGIGDILVPVFIADAEPAAGKLLLPDIPFSWLDCAGPGPLGATKEALYLSISEASWNSQRS